MKKINFAHLLLLLLAISIITPPTAQAGSDVQQAQALARRLSPRLAGKVVFRQLLLNGNNDAFGIEGKDGKVVITGNNANSMAVGLNYYLKKYCLSTVSWYADVPVELPATLPDVAVAHTSTARVPQRFFLNYCTFGYSMPFWQWKDWERFIDWMALNGVNMPLAITGQESVWYNVWTRLGMTDEQVRSYFTGPVYLPWHRMSNIDGWCGPLPKQWLEGQTALQKLILARERALGMRPVLPAFAGHVPHELKTLYPNADIKHLGQWDGFADQYRTYFLNSEDPLYAKIQKMFLQEQSRLFGTDHIYGVDLFNEVAPPSLEPGYLNQVSRHIYESLKAVDKKAQWLQMGWFLYYQRKDFTPERTRAMLTGVPQGKMTMLDYFAERTEVWRMHDKFYGQPYIWCYLGNFGGNTVLHGNVKQAGERLEQALREGGHNLKGIGSTLEGLDVQQFPFEYIFDKAWTSLAGDAQVASDVADRHAGYRSPQARKAWDLLYNHVLTFPAGTRYGTAATTNPVLGKLGHRSALRYDPALLAQTWRLLAAQDSVVTDAMRIDMVWTGRQLLGDLFGYEKLLFDKALAARDTVAMHEYSNEMLSLLGDIDCLNAQEPHCTLDAWVRQARAMGTDKATSDYYEMNARRIITTWGGDLNGYACRGWSGLVRDYYLPCWQAYIDEAMQAVRAGRPFDEKGFNQRMERFQLAWCEPGTPHDEGMDYPHDVLALSRMLLKKYRTELAAFIQAHTATLSNKK